MFLNCLTIFSLLFVCVLGGTLNDSTTLVNDLLSKHNKNVRPVSDHRNKTYVHVSALLKTIQEFDEVREVFTYTVGFHIKWHDAGMVWDPASYGGVDRVKLSYRKVWVPDLIMTSPSNEMESYGRPWQMIDFGYNGHASWSTGGLIKSTCSVDVSMYPFDKQFCQSDFNVWGYYQNEVEIIPITDKVDISMYSGNLAWTLEDSNVVVVVDLTDWAQLQLTFHLRRKPEFIVVNIIMPILFLSMINVLVFLLVPESGERVSFCITVLLAIAVFMTIISDTLPKSSDPLPIISYKLMTDMIISSLITLVTILNLRLYNKDDKIPVPDWLKSVHTAVHRGRQRKIKTTNHKICPYGLDVVGLPDVYDFDMDDQSKAAADKNRIFISDPVNPRLESLTPGNDWMKSEANWKDISTFVDCISFVSFTVLSMLSFIIFIIYVSYY